jgi:hypothetical protein
VHIKSHIDLLHLSETKTSKSFKEAERVPRFKGEVSGFRRRKPSPEILEGLIQFVADA